ncbi:MAG: alkaline phosphatase family protein [Candidatus Micrarchaeaceae archaeon]
MRKVYLIGMDSVPLWILKELRNQKGMEIFDRMLREGTLMDMESTLPPMTGPAWPSIYTGLRPGEHGVPDFFVMKKDYTPDIVYYDSTVVPPFWKILAEAGLRCLVITPATDVRLPSHENIDMLTGFPLPSKTNSQEIGALMKKYKFHGEPDIEADIKAGKMTLEEGARIFVKSIKTRISIASEMMSRHDYDFVYICFTETDRLQHFVMGNDGRNKYLLPIYNEIGSFIGKIANRAEAEGALLVIVSDHGMQPIKSKFLINSWMIKNGYEKPKDAFLKSMGNKGKESMSYGVREKLLKTKLRKVYDKMPYKVKTATFKVLGSAFSGSAAGEYVRMHLFDLDMSRTTAFAAIANEPVSTIWINDSRFSNPTVSAKEKPKVIAKLVSDLKKLKTPDGQKLIVDIIDGPSYYGKTDKFIVPDLFVEVAKGYTIDLFNHSSESNFMKPEGAKSGDHMRHGIFGFYPSHAMPKPAKMHVRDVKSLILKYFKAGYKNSKSR